MFQQQLKEKGFEATLYDSKGYVEQKDKVRSGRGMSESQLACSTRRTQLLLLIHKNQKMQFDAVKSSICEVVIAISSMDTLYMCNQYLSFIIKIFYTQYFCIILEQIVYIYSNILQGSLLSINPIAEDVPFLSY